MQRTKKFFAVAMLLLLSVTCFSISGYAAENALTIPETDSFDFSLMEAVKSTSLSVIVDKDGVENNILKVELDDEKYGFDVWSTLKNAVVSSSCKQELSDKLTEIASAAAQNVAVAQISPYISPTDNVIKTYHYGIEDQDGDDLFYATVTVNASWSRTEDVDAAINDVDVVELSGWADAFTTYDIYITGNTATVQFYNSLIASDCFLEATYSIANNGRMTHNYNYLD